MSVQYPNLNIKSKRDLAKHISHKGFSPNDAMRLINDAKRNFDLYWRDNPEYSKPNKDKYVRSAKGNSLGKLLGIINKRVLGPHDKNLPGIIFGGVSGKDHVKAAKHLLGGRRLRTLLAMDIERFYEQVHHDRVFHFFYKKCNCSIRSAKLLSDFCCVPTGEKGSGSNEIVIARGFATSSRLAVWTNVQLFQRLKWVVKRKLKDHDPRVAVYVDDIGITASRVTAKQMEDLRDEIMNLFKTYDSNQFLNIHPPGSKKNRIVSHDKGIEHLGLRLHRNRLTLGQKTLRTRDRIKARNKNLDTPKEKETYKKQRKAYSRYKQYVEG